MKEELRYGCNLMIENDESIHKYFKWTYGNLHKCCAFLFAYQDKEASGERIKEMKQVIENNTSRFSIYKTDAFLLTASLLALDNNPDETIRKAINVYENMKSEGVGMSVYVAMAAMAVATMGEREDEKSILRHAKRLYQEMKQNHPFITTKIDYGFAILLALTDGYLASMTAMEETYSMAFETFRNHNGAQALSQVLSLWQMGSKEKVEKTANVYQKLKANGYRFSKADELSVLGYVAMVGDSEDEIVEDIIAVYEYLKKQPRYGFWLDKRYRLLFAAGIVGKHYLLKEEKQKVVEIYQYVLLYCMIKVYRDEATESASY